MVDLQGRQVAEGVIPPPPWEQGKKTGTPPAPWETGQSASTLTVSDAARQRLESMKRGPALEQFQQAQASAEADITARQAKADAALQALPYVLAAPFTGGLSVPAAFAVMGGAGLASAAGQEIREAQRGYNKSAGAILASLGLGTGAGLTAEAGSQIVTRGIGWGMTSLPKLVIRSAASTEKGAKQLSDAFVATRQALYSEVGSRPVDISGPLEDAYERLRGLPVGKGAFGEQFSNLTARAEETAGNIGASITAEKKAAKLQRAIGIAKARQAKLETVSSGQTAAREISQRGREIIADLEAKLGEVGSQKASHQPLDALIRERGNLNQLANHDPSLNPEEQKILQDLAGGLDATIRREIRGNPRATELYNLQNMLYRVQMERDASITLAEKVMRKGIGIFTGGFKGFAVDTAMPHLSTMALDKVLNNKVAAPLWMKAVGAYSKGATAAAMQLATQAFKEAGVKESFQDSMRLVSPDDFAAASASIR